MRIGIEQHDVGTLPRFHRAELPRVPGVLGSVGACGLKCLAWCEAGLDWERHLVVKTDTGRYGKA